MLPLFTNLALLTGLAGLSVPILIHLLLRRKSQHLRFSTIQFFVRKDEQSSRKRKLRNLLLLSLRLLLFALIVFAFARPFLPGEHAVDGPARRQQLIVLLDSTASMQAAATGGQPWTRAKDMARQAIGALTEQDRVAIITTAGRAHLVTEFCPPSIAAKKLQALQPTFGGGELVEGLQQVKKVLATANPAYAKSLTIISDLQRNGSQNLASVPLPKSVTVKVLEVGDRFTPNVAITSLELDPKNRAQLIAGIMSYCDDAYPSLRLTLKVDGKESYSTAVVLKAGGSTNLTLPLKAVPAGWHSAECTIFPKDGLEVDDHRQITWHVPQPTRVLLAETRTPRRSFQEETFFVAAALDPTIDTNSPSSSRFQYSKTSTASLSVFLKPANRKEPFEIVVLPGLKEISSGVAGSLKSFVEAGGGLIVYLNETVSPNRYNTELSELLPARLERLETLPEGDPTWRVGSVDKRSPVFAPFRDASQGNLQIPEFTRRFVVSPLPASVVLASFDDGTPLVLQKNIGKGRVLLVNTSSDTAWTDWPKHKTFVPFLHALTHHSAGQSRRVEIEAHSEFLAGTDADLDFEAAAKGATFRFQRESSAEVQLSADNEGRVRDLPISVPGVYTVKSTDGRELRRLAVNFPSAESDLTGMPTPEFQQQIVIAEEPARPALAGLFAETENGRELWRLLLLAALGLLLVEPMVANKTLA